MGNKLDVLAFRHSCCQAVKQHVGLGAAGYRFTDLVYPVVVALKPLAAALEEDYIVASLQCSIELLQELASSGIRDTNPAFGSMTSCSNRATPLPEHIDSRDSSLLTNSAAMRATHYTAGADKMLDSQLHEPPSSERQEGECVAWILPVWHTTAYSSYRLLASAAVESAGRCVCRV